VGRKPITMTGTFLIVVDGVGDTTGAYTLGTSNLRDDNTPIFEGQALSGTVGIVGDEDAYTFQAQAGDPVTVFVDNGTTGGGRRLSVTVTTPTVRCGARPPTTASTAGSTSRSGASRSP